MSNVFNCFKKVTYVNSELFLMLTIVQCGTYAITSRARSSRSRPRCRRSDLKSLTSDIGQFASSTRQGLCLFC